MSWTGVLGEHDMRVHRRAGTHASCPCRSAGSVLHRRAEARLRVDLLRPRPDTVQLQLVALVGLSALSGRARAGAAAATDRGRPLTDWRDSSTSTGGVRRPAKVQKIPHHAIIRGAALTLVAGGGPGSAYEKILVLRRLLNVCLVRPRGQHAE